MQQFYVQNFVSDFSYSITFSHKSSIKFPTLIQKISPNSIGYEICSISFIKNLRHCLKDNWPKNNMQQYQIYRGTRLAALFHLKHVCETI